MSRRRPDYTGDEARAKKAKKQGYAARSVFKLEEIDRRFKLLNRGMRVLDLGAAPGSWSQYAVKKVGTSGVVVAVDKRPIEADLGSAAVLQADVFELEDDVVLAATGGKAPPFDLVVSDMAPGTTGVPFRDHVRSVALCERALDLAERWLQPGGAFVCKLFQGEDEHAFRARLKGRFGKVKGLKPEGTRKNSVEIFLVATGLR